MKKNIILTLIVIAVMAFAVISCVKELEDVGVYPTTKYIGVVVEKSTMQPIKGVRVMIYKQDDAGEHVYKKTETNEQGAFVLDSIEIDGIDKDYYLLLDGSSIGLPSKKEDLKGYGHETYDYKTIILYDKTSPEFLSPISITSIENITATAATCHGTVSTNGDNVNITDKGFVWGTAQEPTLDNNHISLGRNTGNFTTTLTGLTKSTSYYVRAYAISNIDTVYSEQRQFTTTSGKPVVTIAQVTDILATSAVCSGNATTTDYPITDKGFVWSTTQHPTLSNSHVSMGNGSGNFTGTLSDLTKNTTYYVCAYATNSEGTEYSDQKQFTTTSGLPIVTLGNVSNITATSAVCGGSISSNGGYSITDKGLVWSTSQYPTLESNDGHLSLGTGNAAFSGSMTNLSLDTRYYVRAYATNSQGTNYSDQKQFSTTNGKPTVTTTAVTMNGNTAVSGGNVTSDGGYTVTARGICYGIYPNPDLTSAYTHTSDGTGTGYFTSVIDQSMTGTIYVRAYATNANGTSYGNQITVNYDYLALPTFSYNGHTYKVAPDPHTSYSQYMSWEQANTYCEGLTAYGYSDWRMPTKAELETMYQNRTSIGGFIDYTYVSNYYYYSFYHSSTSYNSNYHYVINWNNGSATYGSEYEYYGYNNSGSSRYRCHVRPIRIDQ